MNFSTSCDPFFVSSLKVTLDLKGRIRSFGSITLVPLNMDDLCGCIGILKVFLLGPLPLCERWTCIKSTIFSPRDQLPRWILFGKGAFPIFMTDLQFVEQTARVSFALMCGHWRWKYSSYEWRYLFYEMSDPSRDSGAEGTAYRLPTLWESRRLWGKFDPKLLPVYWQWIPYLFALQSSWAQSRGKSRGQCVNLAWSQIMIKPISVQAIGVIKGYCIQRKDNYFLINAQFSCHSNAINRSEY